MLIWIWQVERIVAQLEAETDLVAKKTMEAQERKASAEVPKCSDFLKFKYLKLHKSWSKVA